MTKGMVKITNIYILLQCGRSHIIHQLNLGDCFLVCLFAFVCLHFCLIIIIFSEMMLKNRPTHYSNHTWCCWHKIIPCTTPGIITNFTKRLCTIDNTYCKCQQNTTMHMSQKSSKPLWQKSSSYTEMYRNNSRCCHCCLQFPEEHPGLVYSIYHEVTEQHIWILFMTGIVDYNIHVTLIKEYLTTILQQFHDKMKT